MPGLKSSSGFPGQGLPTPPLSQFSHHQTQLNMGSKTADYLRGRSSRLASGPNQSPPHRTARRERPLATLPELQRRYPPGALRHANGRLRWRKSVWKHHASGCCYPLARQRFLTHRRDNGLHRHGNRFGQQERHLGREWNGRRKQHRWHGQRDWALHRAGDTAVSE